MAAPKHNKPYADREIWLIWLCVNDQPNKAALAKILGRSEGAIDMVMRHMDEILERGDLEGIGPRPSKNLIAQCYLFGMIRGGKSTRGSIEVRKTL